MSVPSRDRLLAATEAAALLLRDRRVVTLLGVCALLPLHGLAVPAHNESVYLLELARTYDPGIALGDWTLEGHFAEHFVFNHLFGALALWIPLEPLAWLGRLGSWALCLMGWIRLGGRLGVGPWWTLLCILAWVATGAPNPAAAWMFGTFEAKAVAWGCMLFALDSRLGARPLASALWLGASISLHPGVGSWAALAIGLTALSRREPLPQLARYVAWTALAAAPGLLPILWLRDTPPVSADTLEIFVRLHSPYHLDPFSWPPILTLFPFLCWAVGVFTVWRWRRNEAGIWLAVWLSWLGVVFLAGVGWRAAGYYGLMLTLPFRLFGILAPPFAGLFVIAAALDRAPQLRWAGRALLATGLAVCLAFAARWSAPRVQEVMASHSAPRIGGVGPCRGGQLEEVFAWVREGTPPGSVVVSPPWNRDALYWSRRAHIALWWYPRYDDLEGWRRRIESMVGPLSVHRAPPGANPMSADLWMPATYVDLPLAQVEGLASEFGADYIVTPARYPLEVVHRAGVCRVYALERVASLGPDSTPGP